MNKDIAIKFNRVYVNDYKCIYAPISVIRGKYCSDNDQFIADYGIVHCNITDMSVDSENLFGLNTNISELKKQFGENLSEEVLINKYYDLCQDNIYFETYLEAEECTEVTPIPVALIDSLIESSDKQGLQGVKVLGDLRGVEDAIVFTPAPNLEQEVKHYTLDKKESKKMTLAHLRNKVSSVIINQDRAVNDVTMAFIVNQTSENKNHKRHILVGGPSGTGKTKMIDIICKEMGLPYFKADATEYSKVGFEGKSVNSMFEGLIKAANDDIEKAQNGVLVIDEIDKKLSDSSNDVSGKDVLYSLLKPLDRDIVEVEIGSSYSGKKVMFDTSNLTVVFMGAFEEIYDKMLSENKQIGFLNENEKAKPKSTIISRADLIKHGVPAQFVGRLGLITFTDKLSVKDLISILVKSKESPLKEEKEYFNGMGIKNVSFSKGFVEQIALNASKTKTGARTLRSEVTDALKCAYNDILMEKKKNIKELRFTKQTVINPEKNYGSLSNSVGGTKN